MVTAPVPANGVANGVPALSAAAPGVATNSGNAPGTRSPKVFVSFSSHDNVNQSATTFVSDLTARLAEKFPGTKKPHVFYSNKSLKNGQTWESELLKELDRCDYFLPLCSANFFGSPWCSKEWSYFRRRLLSSTPAGQRALDRLIPVWWRKIGDGRKKDKENLHPVLTPYHVGYPDDTPERPGLQRLLRSNPAKYHAYVETIAELIHTDFARRPDPLDPLGLTNFKSLEPAFSPEAAQRKTLETNLIYAVRDDPADWCPFGHSSPVDTEWNKEELYPERIVDRVLRRFNAVAQADPLLPEKDWTEIEGWKRQQAVAALSDTIPVTDLDMEDWLKDQLRREDLSGQPSRTSWVNTLTINRRPKSTSRQLFVMTLLDQGGEVYAFSSPDQLTTALVKGIWAMRTLLDGGSDPGLDHVKPNRRR
ncbi:hypothetical protein BCD48_30360 [Pseudofrankia sp. BMG5.36]|nr:hypothetical protein BCD48_30360 [Pseudofrankia sp. BMG5.36]